MSEPNVPPKPPAPTEEHEFSSRNVRSNIAPIFHILQSEQLILQRTDQKAFTLMSILGVFMVFFIVHFPKIEITYLSGIMVFVYFITAASGLINLMLVIVPRIRDDMGHEDLPEINATFFGGIIQFMNPVEYADYLAEMTEEKSKQPGFLETIKNLAWTIINALMLLFIITIMTCLVAPIVAYLLIFKLLRKIFTHDYFEIMPMENREQLPQQGPSQ